MKTITCGPYTLKIYDSIENIPPSRESLMQQYQLEEFGIGHTWESIDSHLSSLLMAVHQNDLTSVYQEVENLRLNYYSMAQGYNPEHLSWLCLIQSIDGEPFTDMSEENLKEWSKRLGEQEDGELAWRLVFDEVKKKFPENFESTFLNGPLQNAA